MDLSLSDEALAYQAGVREFLRQRLPSDWAGVGALDPDERSAFLDTWRNELRDAGYLAASWPTEVGGGGATLFEQSLLLEEFVRVGVPHFPWPSDLFGVNLIGLTLLARGTDGQRAKFLPRILSGEHRWAQGFSEPNAGSDLFSLTTRAEQRDGRWVLILSSDCVVAAGIALNPYQILPPKARVIHIDRDPARIGMYRRPDLGIVGDAATTARAIEQCLEMAGLAAGSFWIGSGEGRVRAATQPISPQRAADPEIRPLPIRSAMRLANELLPADRFVVIDAGLFLGFAYDGITVTDPKSWIWSMDFGSIGLGLGMSIGASVARPEKVVTAIVGDGGFMMSIQELETAVREKVRLVITVMNDSAYGAEVLVLEDNNQPGDIARHEDVDFAAVAKAFGADGVTIRGPEDIPAAEQAMSALGQGVLVLDFKVTENERHRLMDASGIIY